MNDTKQLEDAVLTYLREVRAPVAMRKIVDEVAESGAVDPADLKLAAFRLVDRGRAQLNKRWEFTACSVAG